MLKRLWINISIALVFIGLSVTGIILYLVPYNALFSGVHIWLGISFLAAAGFHIALHLRPMLRYCKKRAAMLVVGAVGAAAFIIVFSVNYRVGPLSSVLDFSNKLRKTAVVRESHSQTYMLAGEASGKAFTIEAKAGEEYRVKSKAFLFGKTLSAPPQFVFWLEDMEGGYLSTIFVTAKTGYPILHPEDKLRSNIVYRKEAFPYWLHKRKLSVDGITGATPHGHFNIEAGAPGALRQFRVLAEVNRSFDFNAFYTEDKYPDDPIYSGDGYPGQPSVIYAVDIDLNKDDSTYVMKPIGHGHYSGADGELYTDMSGIDSALTIFQRVLVQF